MRQEYRVLVLLFVTAVVISRLWSIEETDAYRRGTDEFVRLYNSGEHTQLFDFFSPEMQTALPLETTVSTFSGLQKQHGKIIERQFVRYKQTFAIYKAAFERNILSLQISFNDTGKINGLLFTQYIPEVPVPERNMSTMRLPFEKRWYVFWGGDTQEQNYHVDYAPFKNAFDFVIVDDEVKSYRSTGKTNEDYYAFNQRLFAPCEGEVVLVVDGIKDNVPGMMDPYFAPGNTVIIKTVHNEYVVLCHFKQWSIRVKQGQKVKKGKYLGRCGNSGNSSEPHLHFHIQNVENINYATGIKCFFESLSVDGHMKKDYSPVQKEIIEHIQ